MLLKGSRRATSLLALLLVNHLWLIHSMIISQTVRGPNQNLRVVHFEQQPQSMFEHLPILDDLMFRYIWVFVFYAHWFLLSEVQILPNFHCKFFVICAEGEPHFTAALYLIRGFEFFCNQEWHKCFLSHVKLMVMTDNCTFFWRGHFWLHILVL